MIRFGQVTCFRGYGHASTMKRMACAGIFYEALLNCEVTIDYPSFSWKLNHILTPNLSSQSRVGPSLAKSELVLKNETE